MSLALSMLPIPLAILAGYLAAALGAVPRDKWDGINILNFRILIPATLIHALAVADLSSIASGTWILALLATLAVAGGAVLALRRMIDPARLPDPAFTTLFQTTTRWNAFIALAAAGQFLGPEGIALLALAMAVLIPVINIANIVVLVVWGAGRSSVLAILRSVATNPLVLGSLFGLAVNLSGIGLPQPILQALDLIARAALGMGLLAVGAGILLQRLLDMNLRIWLGTGLRLLLCPSVFLALALALGLTTQEALAGVLIFSVPAAANGYVVAQRMGGDAGLYADVLTWQTILSMITLPVLISATLILFAG